MKNTFPVSAAVAVTLMALAGCSSNSNHSGAGANNGQAQNSQAWSLRFSTSCAGTPDEGSDCVGSKGFKISSDKSFLIGPAENGETKSGNLSDEDFNSFNVYLAQLVGIASPLSSGTDTNNGKCEAFGEGADSQQGGEEHLVLSFGNRETEISVLKEGQLCSQVGNLEVSKRLHEAVKKLVEKHYTLPFPDLCGNAVTQLRGLFAEAQKCSTEADCFYVGNENSFAELIPPGTSRYVVVDSCSMVPQLSVANGGALSGLRGKLESATLEAEKACSKNILRESCTEYTGFESSLGAPVCQEGVCRITPKFTSSPRS